MNWLTCALCLAALLGPFVRTAGAEGLGPLQKPLLFEEYGFDPGEDAADVGGVRGTILPARHSGDPLSFDAVYGGWSFQQWDALNGVWVADPQGWTGIDLSTGGVGDFLKADLLSEMPPPAVPEGCDCPFLVGTDSNGVLNFRDDGFMHPPGQDNIALSPPIAIPAGSSGKALVADVYWELPPNNFVFAQFYVQWSPWTDPLTGAVGTSPLTPAGPAYYGPNSPRCDKVVIDLSAIVPPTATQVRLGVGVVNDCDLHPVECSLVTNSTPWFDNIFLGVHDPSPGIPVVSVPETNRLQDAFASDGTLNVSSPARVDVNTIRNPFSGGPAVLGDTLVALCGAEDVEVQIAFRVTPGPDAAAQAALAAWAAARWTPEPSLGAGWYSARLDTAEVAGLIYPGRWMSTLHESDPHFIQNPGKSLKDDAYADPSDPSQLANDIFPDDILTPGSRIDYFVRARYLPAGAWGTFPDVAGDNYLEMEVLPSSIDASGNFNHVLYVNHHAGRDGGSQFVEEQGLDLALGTGGNNYEGTRWDRFDVSAPSSGQGSIGRPAGASFGAASAQFGGYDTVVWHSANVSGFNLSPADDAVIQDLLAGPSTPCPSFWGTGNDLAFWMLLNELWGYSSPSLLYDVMGVYFGCSTIRDVNCPLPPLGWDWSFCMPVTGVSGSAFASPGAQVKGNGCPLYRSFDVLELNPAATGALGQMGYIKNGTPVDFASVTNDAGPGAYRTVLDGFGVGYLRAAGPCTDPGKPNAALTASGEDRAVAVLGWFCAATSAVGPDPRPDAGLALGRIWPNPARGKAHLPLTSPTGGVHVQVQIFDVAGRLVRNLLDGDPGVGTQDLIWDGRRNDGSPAGSGLYFVRMSAGAVQATRRLVLIQ